MTRQGWVKVWDPLVRGLHWTQAALLVAAWVSAQGWLGWLAWHEVLGECLVAWVTVRLAWGWLGPRHARFSSFVVRPGAAWRYACQLARGQAPRHLGHNPLGGWMIVAMLAVLSATLLTGWLFTTDWLWGYAWLAELHEGLAWTLLALAALHVLGVLVSSLLHQECLVCAMWHGRKRPPAAGDQA